jgi:hypothetical protein
MADSQRSAEAVKKIQVLQGTIKNHESNISKIQHDKNEKTKYFDQQIKQEQDRIEQWTQQIEMLKHQI